MKKLKYNLDLIKISNINEAKISKINILNIIYKKKKLFSKISSDSKNYISECFKISLELIKKNKIIDLIIGQI